jgi:hypothetical protein
MPTKILIASPTYDGSVRVEYMRALFQTTDYFNKAGIGWDMVVEPSTVLHIMRSVMATKAVLESDFTHLLFIDTDMGFSASIVQRMVEADKALIAAIYPYRAFPLHEVVEEGGKTLRQLISEKAPYAVRFAPDTTNITIAGGICEVDTIGTGLMLIKTDALRTMIDKAGIEKFANHFPYDQWLKNPFYYAFFDHIIENGMYLGEDYSFCRRWQRHMGEPIHAICDTEIMHVGNLPVIGNFMDKLRTGKLT